ncbi:hypothetical protein D9758_002301 [Tetrapyrgos nigripes]|uniref:CBF1-interacting co-repressor CIR N-terminal domain-containing protein n=1 Tax=Tetrapyrgos nigripes TaxID=182062 RepID=A0A8H5GP50_9AGAR|nr:hypothetical protein D9758_002301 [Tetrapyrgos nigripes]
MGGGDLNMKKSWHPLLLKNQERVWLEEKKALEEKKKLDQLRKEKEEERQLQELQRMQEEQTGKKRTEKLEWMYTTPATGSSTNANDLEDYLLGKKRVDKILTGDENAKVGAAHKNFIAVQNANNVRDVTAKIREDPLLAIKQQEQASYERLMSNPLRLREMQERNGIKSSKLSKKEKKREKEERRKEKEERRRLKAEGKSRRVEDREYRDRDRDERDDGIKAEGITTGTLARRAHVVGTLLTTMTDEDVTPTAVASVTVVVAAHLLVEKLHTSVMEKARKILLWMKMMTIPQVLVVVTAETEILTLALTRDDVGLAVVLVHRVTGTETAETEIPTLNVLVVQAHLLGTETLTLRLNDPVEALLHRILVLPTPNLNPPPNPNLPATAKPNAPPASPPWPPALLPCLPNVKEEEARKKSKGMGDFISTEQKKVFGGTEGGLEDRIRRGRGGMVIDRD